MDKHEYEINQLINPKKDIVKSNSKHRDKIETLIQGRRVGGITRGGDTPVKETLWAKTKVGNSTYIAKVENGVVNPIGQIIQDHWFVTDVDESGVCLHPKAGEGITEGLWVPRLNNYTGLKIEAGDFIDLGYRENDVIPDFSKYVSIP